MFRRWHWMRVLALVFVCLLQPGCGSSDHPGNWPQSKVESMLTERMQLKSISLAPGDGGFSGTAVSPDGESWKLKVTQDAGKRRLDYEAEGDRGSTETGYFSG